MIKMLMERIVFRPFCKLKASLLGKRFGIKCVINTEYPLLKIHVEKGKNAKFSVNGLLYFLRYLYLNQPVNIILKDNSTLEVEGDLMIGSGTTIYVGENAYLRIGGRLNERIDGAAILGSKIFVHKKVTIGHDCLITYEAGIIDSNFHHLEYNGETVVPDSEVNIGNHVWILGSALILKGSTIEDGCIVGHKSVISGKTFPAHSFIAGAPARIMKRGCDWRSTIE